ncbi:MAG TPA: hypothetical protein VGE74_05015 [Gemmata sp.]
MDPFHRNPFGPSYPAARGLNGAYDAYRDFFRAKLTAKTLVAGQWLYDWIEQTFDPADGSAVDANPARRGGYADGTASSPALELNNAALDLTAPVYVHMRQKGFVGGQVVYEFEYAPPGAGAPRCVEWYSIYLHQQSVTVAAGDPVGPRQQIGAIGPYEGDLPHAHVAIGDGVPLAAPNGFPVAGQSIDIATWLGFPIVGAHTGDPPGAPARFTPEQLAVIRAHFGAPVDEGLPWSVGIGSSAHDLWDYYAIDLVLLDAPGAAIGKPVYAAFTGADVRTTCIYAENLGGNFQWVTILKHQLGDCAPCPPSKVICEQGYLRRYTCDPSGEWAYDGDLGVPCEPPEPPGSGPGSGSGSGSGGSGPYTAPTAFDAVSEVCSRFAECQAVTGDYAALPDDGLIAVDATDGAVTVTLPTAEPAMYFRVVKTDPSENEVTVTAAGAINGEADYTISGQWVGAQFEALCPLGDWWAFRLAPE